MRGSLRQLKPIVAGSGGGRRSEGDIVCVPTLQVGSIHDATVPKCVDVDRVDLNR